MAEVPDRDHDDVQRSAGRRLGTGAEWGRLPDAFLHSGLLPPTEIIEELAARHQAFLDELDEEFSPPSPEDVERAERVLNELKAGGL